MKCDLCGADEALENRLLCTSCRESIVRLLAISEAEQNEQKDIPETGAEAVEQPETEQNTREARS